ncbi:MAG TPA: hypothetical protein VKD19_08390 [Pseudolabrys sp.]|nr:hypothetical protein [Pseudolabrys sp.]
MRRLWHPVTLFALLLAMQSIAVKAADINVEKMPRSKNEGEYRNYPDVYRIQITGELKKNDNQKFSDAVSKLLPLFGIVILDSPGGELSSALAIGKEIKLRGYSTVVKARDTCASACALVWLAGDTRYMEPSSKIGFHAASVMKGNAAVESGFANALVGAYLDRLGLTTEAIEYITRPSPSDVQWLSIRHAMLLGINVTISSEINSQK